MHREGHMDSDVRASRKIMTNANSRSKINEMRKKSRRSKAFLNERKTDGTNITTQSKQKPQT